MKFGEYLEKEEEEYINRIISLDLETVKEFTSDNEIEKIELDTKNYLILLELIQKMYKKEED